MAGLIDTATIDDMNARDRAALQDDFEALGARLAPRNIDIGRLLDKVKAFAIAIPSWGVGTGGRASPAFRGPASRGTCSTSFTAVRWFSNSPA